MFIYYYVITQLLLLNINHIVSYYKKDNDFININMYP